MGTPRVAYEVPAAIQLAGGAAALATESGDFESALKLAETSLSSGAALGKLDELVAFSTQVAA